ncbi:GGDEF domain-containing protein [Wukongibacter sp. M2B1]|uniref:GGDEF domain-containing protein n=1 Tax=Wukongibacter sp. M2B1 TaxID=3088895 RepID=UPI003D7A7F2F
MNHKDQLSNVLKEELVTTLFQPVVSLKTGDIIGYEALGRGPKNSLVHRPVDLLSLATKHNKQIELELLFKKNAIEKIKSSKNNLLFFINVESNTITNYTFSNNLTNKLLTDYNISPSSIVFEITEKTAIEDYDSFKSALEYCCSQGFRIALDDVGSGLSGMKAIKEIHPNFLKIDIDLIREIDRDNFKQAIVNSFVSLATATNIKLIAEGIETREELETLIRLGVYGGQGYFLQKPCEVFLDIPNKVMDTILDYNNFLNNSSIYNNTYSYIGSIVEQNKSFNIGTPCGVIKSYFERSNLDGACITNNDLPVGLIMSHNLDSSLAHQYGIALYYNRPISLIMDYSALIVDYQTPINIVSEQAMSRPDKKTYDNIIVTKNSKYFGIVSVKKLLQYAISFEKSYARELNPLTQLPGNVIINRVLNDAITLNRICCILYFDLDNFKVYNDLYGFENGDKVIKLTADIINKNIKSDFPYTSFVGHIGGDDFVSLIECRIEDCEVLCEKIISEFDKSILDCFNEIDRKNKYIAAEDRNGKLKNFNLTSLSIAGFYGNPKDFNTVENFAKFMGTIKKDVKKINHSSYIVRKMNNKLS